ncbi:Las1-domain-containing protein [Delitschia confertaspora ATCC 74209]|uniref:Las1-domain-containing protein n=1 Tax=Delitschia confertaspora ATCC 74209 TaxID=1513339 RepID=A0A9P4JK90_9PLEO|nr:Las1-domain-containing protein [Delitschia confertaspora ATCC 74209]
MSRDTRSRSRAKSPSQLQGTLFSKAAAIVPSKRKTTSIDTPKKPAKYITTFWRDPQELVDIRQKLYRLIPYENDDRRQEAIGQIKVWRARKQSEIPLAIDSTLNFIAVQLQAEKWKYDAAKETLSLLYASAIARFVTGFCDTRSNIERLTGAPAGNGLTQNMDTSAKELKLPVGLIETRHNIVHGELPPLSVLIKSAEQSLAWLWEWYWAKIDDSYIHSSVQDTQDLAGALKSYVTERKAEIRNAGSKKEAGKSATSVKTTKALLNGSQNLPLKLQALAQVLVDENTIVPKNRAAGTPMLSAFTLWTPLLLSLSHSAPSFLRILTSSLIYAMGTSPSASSAMGEVNPRQEAMFEWLKHVLTSPTWSSVRELRRNERFVFDIKAELASDPSVWNVKLLEALAKDGDTSVWGRIVNEVKSADIVASEKIGVADGVKGRNSSSCPARFRGPAMGFTRWEGRFERTPIGV